MSCPTSQGMMAELEFLPSLSESPKSCSCHTSELPPLSKAHRAGLRTNLEHWGHIHRVLGPHLTYRLQATGWFKTPFQILHLNGARPPQDHGALASDLLTGNYSAATV